MRHSISLFALLLLLAVPCLAAPRDVTVTFKTADGKPLPAAKFQVFDGKSVPVAGAVENGTAKIQVPEAGAFSLSLEPSLASRVPGQLWHGLAVKDEAAKWDLTVAPPAAVAGKIVLPGDKPAAGCVVSVQSGSRALVQSGIFGRSGGVMAHGAKNAFAMTPTAADGSFTLSGLVPGNYALDVYEPKSKKLFTIPLAPALEADAKDGVPTKIGTWTVPENAWDWLLDAKLEHGAEPSKFTGQGAVKVENGVLRLGEGNDLTGMRWDDKTLPRENYEISLDARRTEGGDFFCGLSFPIGDKHASWIVGGWGGTVIGLSNVNGFSADENETTQTREFENGRWYRLRLRVAKAKIEAWIDDDKLINLPTKEKEFSVRWSVEPSLPLGIATWRTTGELRDIRWRRLDASEVAEIEKTVEE